MGDSLFHAHQFFTVNLSLKSTCESAGGPAAARKLKIFTERYIMASQQGLSPFMVMGFTLVVAAVGAVVMIKDKGA